MFYIFAIDLHEIPFLLYSAKRSGHRQPKSILVCCLPAGRQQKGTYFTKYSKSKKRNKKTIQK